MPEQEQRDRGVRESAAALIGSATEHIKSHIDLLRLEALNAIQNLRKISIVTAIGLAFLICGYSLMTILAIHLAARSWFEGDETIPLATAAVINIFAGFVLLLIARSSKRRAKYFQETMDQIDRDRQWLQKLKD